MGAYWQGSTAANQTAFFDNTKINVAQPSISVTGGPLNFPNTFVGASSASQSYNVSGSDLTANLVVTAPSTDFQVSTDNTNFSSSVSLTPASGAVASTPIYVRFTPQSAGAKSGNVTNASTGATTQNVAVSGAGVACPTTLTVNDTGDAADAVAGDGSCATAGSVCTLRAAIQEADALTSCGGTININFNIPGAGVRTISPASALPIITRPVIINGYSQPLATASTSAVGDNANLLVELNGTSAGAGSIGLEFGSTAGNSSVRGLVVNRFGSDGIRLTSTSGCVVAGNFIGTNAAGTTGLSNGGNGILINQSSGNTVGGSVPSARNVISGNIGGPTSGVEINGDSSDNNFVIGNYIGTDATGTVDIGNNFDGVNIFDGDSNTIGGSTSIPGTPPGNLISGSGAGCGSCDGVDIGGPATGNTVQGNLIGTSADGTTAIGNHGNGVFIQSPGNVIGGSTATPGTGVGNVISGNAGNGILVNGNANCLIQGNIIGLQPNGIAALGNLGSGVRIELGFDSTIGGTAAGTGNLIASNGGGGVAVLNASSRNAIRGNSIHDNGTLGIDLNDDGVTSNDSADGDTGSNNLQNFPVITSAVTGTPNVIQGTLNSTQGQTFTIDFYSNSTCDASGNGEGATYLGNVTTGTTDGSGNVSFTFNPTSLASGQVITATATDASNNTSEFSACFTATAPKYRSAVSGNWNSNLTWEQSPDGVTWSSATSAPTAATADTIQIRSPHTVTVTANVDADQLTVDSGGTLSVNNGVTFIVADGAGTDLTDNGTVAAAGQINNNGQAVVNNTLQVDQGGFPGGGAGAYSYDQTNGVLVFNNSSGSFGVNNVNFWPTANGPQNVNVKGAGGITMNVARTVGLLFQYAAGVSGAGNLTLNGTSQVNTGGFTSGSPNYGASSLLKYNVNASYGRNGEWLPNATGGAGYPANVQLSNNTNLDLPNGSAGALFQMSGSLTIDSGSTMNLNGSPAMTQPLIVLGNVTDAGTLALSSAPGGDIKVGGNWTRSGAFTPNGRAVFFNGAGPQTITRSPAASESFDYLVVDKPSGNLTLSSSPATGVLVNATSGNALQLLNSGGIDLNGQTLVMQNSGGSILASGGARTVTGTAGSGFTFTGSKSVTSAGGGTLVFDTNVNVTLNAGVDFGALVSTVNGTLSIGGGGFVNVNPPTYGAASTLLYNCNCTFARSAEWTSALSGPGAPNNVTVNAATDLDLGSTTPGTALQAAGNLTANSGGRVLMTLDDNSHAMTAALTVLKDVNVNAGGTLRLSIVSGGDMKVQGGFTNNGTFTPNNRAVFFQGTASQNVTDASGTATLPYVRVNKGGGTVLLQSNLTTLGPSGGDSLQFLGTTNTLTLNGKTVTLGSTVGTAPAGSGFVGDAAASLSLQDGGTPGAMGALVFVSGSQLLGSLTINRTGANASATLGSDLTVGGPLNLTAGDIITGSNVLTHNGTSAGATDVVGNVRRTDLGATARSFGNPNNQLSFQTGTAPTEMTVNLVKNVPTGAGLGYPGAVKRTYTITPTGGSGYTATLRLHYNDSDLNGNAEALLDFWRFNGASWSRVTKTLADPIVDNWIQTSAVTQFSPWTIAQGRLLTKARLVEFDATQYDTSTTLAWKTGYEVDNLGFNVYREVAGRRTQVNASLIAGSALVAGQGVALTAGNSYTWTDAAGGANARYWLEEIDVEGRSTLHGPFAATRVAGRGGSVARSPLVTQLGAEGGAQAQRQVTASDASQARLSPTPGGGPTHPGALEKQRWLASQESVKISVRASGWYSVTREQLIAAGLRPSADPVRLQMYAGGVEVPIHLNAEGWPQPGGALEFYGEALDVTSTDTRVYWLVEGDSAGLRTDGGRSDIDIPIDPVDPVLGRRGATEQQSVEGISPTLPPIIEGLEYFDYTVERRDRTVYFSSLQNGDAENFFGQVVNAAQSTQTLTARNVYQPGAGAARLEVSLQGVTGGAHHVIVRFNGAVVGALDFAGTQLKSDSFDIAPGLLNEGDNQVQLISSGSSDVSLTDHLRLTYQHNMRADDDRLRFSAAGGAVSVGGFTSPDIRLVDVTDPASPSELSPDAAPVQGNDGTWSLTFNVRDSSELLAVAAQRVMSPVGVAANKPSSIAADIAQPADLLVITHGDFAQQVAPLAAQRSAEGMAVKVLDVEDLYDEFSYGAHTPQAVRDFLELKRSAQGGAPTYVLLVGDGTYDPRDHLGRGRFDLVPSKLLDAGAMETASDDWFADFDDDGIADFAVGRLPVRTQAEAATVVNKIVSRTFDSSQTSALMVADRDGSDGYNFETATDAVQSLLPAGANVSRINRRSQDASVVRSQIVSGVNAGPLVVNWMGHGSIDVWTGDGLLRGSDAASLTNGNRLPLFVMMTCLNGYYEGTGLDSLAESVLKAEHGGAYAVWASSGMTEPAAQADANRELYRVVFSSSGPLRLGDAVRAAKAATADRDVRRTWVFFGDPSSTLR